MSVSIIDKYLETEMGDIDLYSVIGECTNLNRQSVVGDNGNGEEAPEEENVFVSKNHKLRKRNSVELYKHKNVINRKSSLVISKDSDRVYDNVSNHKAAIHYKRYGQFLSLSNDANPEKKYIIDMFDLYSKLDKKPKHLEKKNFFKKFSKFFNLS